MKIILLIMNMKLRYKVMGLFIFFLAMMCFSQLLVGEMSNTEFNKTYLENLHKDLVIQDGNIIAEKAPQTKTVGQSVVYKNINLRNFTRALKFYKGNLTGTKAIEFKIRDKGRKGEVTLLLPPISRDEYSEGFEYVIHLQPPHYFKRCVAYLVLKAESNIDSLTKDYILTCDENGKPIDKVYVHTYTKEYVLGLGNISNGQIKRLFILGQNQQSARKQSLSFRITDIGIEYYDIVENTDNFIRNLKVSRYEKQGTDFGGVRYSLKRLNKPVSLINIAYDYDFENLRIKEKKLRGIDRKKVLKHIFKVITREAKTNTEKQLAILKFVHKVSYSSALQPIYPDKIMVVDPLVLLELGEMACGQANRLAIDLFDSVGIRGRLVQMGQHVVAEIFYDDSWHYFDGIIFGNGETVINEKGQIPSILELNKHPFAIDALSFNMEKPGVQLDSNYYPSWWYFGKGSYNLNSPMFYEKVKNNSLYTRFYGWNAIKIVPDSERKLCDFHPFFEPGAIVFKNIKVIKPLSENHVNVRIDWEPSIDIDEDLLGYHVYCSEKSRGWSQSAFGGTDHTAHFWNDLGGWKPEMYEKLFQEPPHEIALVVTQDTSVILSLEQEKTYFITIMPFDLHGKEVGKKLYQMSSEIKIDKYTLGIAK